MGSPLQFNTGSCAAVYALGLIDLLFKPLSRLNFSTSLCWTFSLFFKSYHFWGWFFIFSLLRSKICFLFSTARCFRSFQSEIQAVCPPTYNFWECCGSTSIYDGISTSIYDGISTSIYDGISTSLYDSISFILNSLPARASGDWSFLFSQSNSPYSWYSSQRLMERLKVTDLDPRFQETCLIW